jgi:PTS system fructose-specific IIA component/PTS system nitrogen regulatory IIA component
VKWSPIFSRAHAIDHSHEEEMIESILKRESLASTGIGNGVAVPQTSHHSVDCLTGVLAVSQEGVEFNSLDNQPVYLIFLIISPEDYPCDQLRALESISNYLQRQQ